MSRGSPHAWIAFTFIAALSACAPGKNQEPTAQELPAAKGETVSELSKSVVCVFQARNGDYWFAGDDRVYRYVGRTLVRFTMNDGNQVRRIQEDKAGRIYFTTFAGVIRFDGTTFTTLSISTKSSPEDWKLQPDDLWFAGPSDSGVVYRYDGHSLHCLKIPKTEAGEAHFAVYPRSKFPNAKYSPYDVNPIFKDSKGSIWFGTATLGAGRYDGKTFTWIPEDELRHGSFSTRSIVEDKDGRFWFCSSLNRYEIDLNDPAKFKRVEGIRDAKDPTRELIDGIVSGTLDGTGALWLATYREGVWRYDGKNITRYPVMDGDQAVPLFSIQLDNQGALWLGTLGAGAYKLNGGTFEKFRP